MVDSLDDQRNNANLVVFRLLVHFFPFAVTFFLVCFTMTNCKVDLISEGQHQHHVPGFIGKSNGPPK